MKIIIMEHHGKKYKHVEKRQARLAAARPHQATDKGVAGNANADRTMAYGTRREIQGSVSRLKRSWPLAWLGIGATEVTWHDI